MNTLIRQPHRKRSTPSQADLGARIRHILIEHRKYLDPDYSARLLQGELKVSGHLLSWALKESFGMRYAALINHLRIERAQEMLADSRYRDVSLDNLALWLGYHSRQIFHAAFRHETGMTPTQFRRRKGASSEQ